jgi:putative ABC transport system substrate-binding protein
MRLDLRWHGDDTNRLRALAQELVGLQPDIILTAGTPATAAVKPETQTIPIVFVTGDDPVAQRIVARLDRPGGNISGFAGWERSLGGKLLKKCRFYLNFLGLTSHSPHIERQNELVRG